MISLFLKNDKGFTMVEALVAIGILSMSILATFTAVQASLQLSTNVKDQIVAFYLVQDAMEYIKSVRDKNALSSVSGNNTNWLEGLSAVTTDPCWYGGGGVGQKTCAVDSYAAAAYSCGNSFGTCTFLRQDSATGLYHYAGLDPLTRFRREIQITKIKDDEIKVNISVDWTQRGGSKSFQVSELIFKRQ